MPPKKARQNIQQVPIFTVRNQLPSILQRAHWRKIDPLRNTVNENSLAFRESGESSLSAIHLAGKVTISLGGGDRKHLNTRALTFICNMRLKSDLQRAVHSAANHWVESPLTIHLCLAKNVNSNTCKTQTARTQI